jgi:hypothetical protein
MWKQAAGYARDHLRVTGSPPRSPDVGFDDFQWPPKSGTVGTDVQRSLIGDRLAGPWHEFPLPDQSQSVAGDDALVVAFRRPIEQRQAAVAGTVSDPIRSPAPAALRRHRGPRWLPRSASEAAIVVLVVVGALEAGYVLRIWSNQASEGGESFTATSPSAAPGAIRDPGERGAKAAKVAAGVARPLPASVSPGGRLTVRSDPPGAKVWIDDRAAGVTPLTLSNLPAGERRLLLKHGDRAIRQTVRIEPDAAVAVIVPLTPVSPAGSGWLAVRASLDMDVLENGVVVGTTRSPRIMLPAGTHHLQLVDALTGYDRSERVNIAAGEVARLEIPLPQSSMSLNALPWAEVWLDGSFIGETPLGNLSVAVGTHQLTFRHPELGEKSLSAVVKAGAPTRITADMRK